MLKNFSLFILVVFLIFIVNALSVSAKDNRCAPLFNMNCAECHELARGCGLLGESPKEWKELLEFMEEMGADIPEEEQALLIDCLSKPDDTIKEACKNL